MSEQRLYCKLCHTPISRPLTLDERIREFDPARQDDSVQIPKGEAWIVEIRPGGRHQLAEKAIWFSPEALTDDAKTDPEAFGCCGFYVRNNTRCQAGHIVGSRIDDCARQPRFEPNLKMTYWAAASDYESEQEVG